jgi:DNA-binding Lrp family transcriptional regulator
MPPVGELQQDGHLTVTELAGRVYVSLSPCHRRLRASEQSGAISGYHAHLDANALGLTFEALIFATMRAGDRDTVDAFEQAVAAIPDVLQAQRLFGDPDYLLRIITRDLPADQQLYDNRLATIPDVRRLSSTLVMKVSWRTCPAPMRTGRARHLTAWRMRLRPTDRASRPGPAAPPGYP